MASHYIPVVAMLRVHPVAHRLNGGSVMGRVVMRLEPHEACLLHGELAWVGIGGLALIESLRRMAIVLMGFVRLLILRMHQVAALVVHLLCMLL